MKTLIHHLKRFSIYTLLLGAVGFAGCEDENRQDMTPEIGEGEVTPKITMYTPTAGGKSTSLTLYGTHFGTDLDNIRVTSRCRGDRCFGEYYYCQCAERFWLRSGENIYRSGGKYSGTDL